MLEIAFPSSDTFPLLLLELGCCTLSQSLTRAALVEKLETAKELPLGGAYQNRGGGGGEA